MKAAVYCRNPAIVALVCCIQTLCWPSTMLWWSGQRQVIVPLLEVPNKIIGSTQQNCSLQDWSNPRLGVISLFLVAGAGVDGLVLIVVLSLVPSTAQIVGTKEPWLCLPTGNYHQGCRPIMCKFIQHSSNYTKLGKDILIKV